MVGNIVGQGGRRDTPAVHVKTCEPLPHRIHAHQVHRRRDHIAHEQQGHQKQHEEQNRAGAHAQELVGQEVPAGHIAIRKPNHGGGAQQAAHQHEHGHHRHNERVDRRRHGPDECHQQDLAKASEVTDDHLEQSVETPSGRKAVVQRSAQRRRLQKRTGEHHDNEVEQEERRPGSQDDRVRETAAARGHRHQRRKRTGKQNLQDQAADKGQGNRDEEGAGTRGDNLAVVNAALLGGRFHAPGSEPRPLEAITEHGDLTQYRNPADQCQDEQRLNPSLVAREHPPRRHETNFTSLHACLNSSVFAICMTEVYPDERGSFTCNTHH